VKKNNNLNSKKTTREILLKILLYILPLLLVLNFLIDSLYESKLKTSENKIMTQVSEESNSFEKTIQTLFHNIFQDIFIVENANEFEDFLKEKSFENKVEARKLFSRYISNKKDYLQLRFLGPDGKEVIRVDRINGKIVVTPEEKLQEKHDRYYFKNCIKTDKEGIYISNLDLNVEFGKVVVPHIPVIRFSKPLRDSSGKLKGVLVINYDGKKFIKSFGNYFHESKELLNISLIDNNGYYLYNKDKVKNYGFIFGEAVKKNTIKEDNPELWSAVTGNFEKIVEIEDEIFYFKKIIPKFEENIFFENENYYWGVMADIKKEDIKKIFPEVIYFKKNMKLYTLFIVFLVGSTVVATLHLKKKESVQLYLARLLLSYVDDAVMIIDAKKNIVDFNEGFLKLTGYSRDEVLSLNRKIFDYSKSHPKLYEDVKKKLINGDSWNGELWLRRKDGSKYPANLTINNIKNLKTKETEYYVSLTKDLSSEKEREAEIEYLLTHDSKSDLPNQIMFNNLIDEEIENKNKFSIIYIKLKKYDKLEIKYNEKILQLIYREIIKKINFLREDKDNISHLSRDVFIAVLKIPIDEKSLRSLLIELSSKLKSDIDINDKNVSLEFDLGAVIFPEHGKSSKELLRKAMFSIKALKYYPEKDFLIYENNLEKKVRREMDIEEHLSLAIKNNEFEMYFQPQINSKEDRIVGIESLIRWNNPILGNVSPMEFIPIAEEVGLISEIGMWVIKEVARLTKSLGLYRYRDIKISINLSSQDFKNIFLVEDILYILDLFNLDPKQFEIELTEGVLVDNYENVNSKLEEFQINGISIALDDFGTGFSSLTYLKRLKFDKIKIDRTFIKDYPETDTGEIAEFITHLSKKLRVKVIAEGAETMEQVEFLQRIGCNEIQGYYYSKPLPASEIKKYIEDYFKKNDLEKDEGSKDIII